MSARLSVLSVLIVFVVAGWARGDGATAYSGTFEDKDGRKGPLTCELSLMESGKWQAKFSAENKGSGPQKPFSCTVELDAKEEGDALSLSGDVPAGGTPYVLSAVVVADKTVKATFKKSAGGGDGTFDLTLGAGAKAAEAPKE